MFLYVNKELSVLCTFFLTCYLATERPTLRHWRGDSLTHPMLIIMQFLVRREDHGEPCNKVGSKILVERTSVIQTGNPSILIFMHYPSVPVSPNERIFGSMEEYLVVRCKRSCYLSFIENFSSKSYSSIITKAKELLHLGMRWRFR